MAASSLALFLCILSLLWSPGYGQGSVPALYVFGDSLADVGNNDHLDFSLLKANFPHNGVDYPGKKATGRFSNGKNAADFFAEKLGLPSPPPYLAVSSSSNKTDIFLKGVNFASGGAGVQDATNSKQCLTLNKQIDYYATVYTDLVQQLGSAVAESHLAKSIFTLVIGSNDLFGYVKSDSSSRATPQQFVDTLVSSLQGQLKRIYNLGARKFLFVGTGPVGCCPSQRSKNSTGDCNAEANNLSVLYNRGVASLLQEMKSELGEMNYSFFDTYSALYQYINKPASSGFTEVKSACCGLGDLNAKVACLPIATYCPNRKDHIFWDFYHPTERTSSLLTSTAFDGSAPFVYPINIQQLSTL